MSMDAADLWLASLSFLVSSPTDSNNLQKVEITVSGTQKTLNFVDEKGRESIIFGPSNTRVHAGQRRQRVAAVRSPNAEESNAMSLRPDNFPTEKFMGSWKPQGILLKIYFCLDITEIQTEVHTLFLADSITNVHLAKMTSLIGEQRKRLGMNLI